MEFKKKTTAVVDDRKMIPDKKKLLTDRKKARLVVKPASNCFLYT